MGEGFNIKCTTCDYDFEILSGVGFAHSPNAVFYGRCDSNPERRWSICFPDGICKPGTPLLLEIIESESIRERALKLIADGAKPCDDYEYDLYLCPNCMNLENLFYFKLLSLKEHYEPDYRCEKCQITLQRVKVVSYNERTLQLVYRNNHKADWRCPKCGSNHLVHGGRFINWD